MTYELIRNLINQNITNDIEYSNTDSLFDKGILNSIRILQLILHMEKAFNIKINQFDMDLEDFETVECIYKFLLTVKNKKG
jgi:phosphopantetheine attachment domain protein